MPHSTTLRLVRDEEAPDYDGRSGCAPFVMVPIEAGETILATLGPAHFAVYWHLCRRADNGTGRCHPSLDAIAEATRLSRKHVTRCLKALEEDGWIGRQKRSNRYHMATSTEYTVYDKQRTDGCDMIGTRSGHDGVRNVTRTRIGLDVELERKNTPLPPKGKRPTYSDEFNAFWLAYPSGHGVKKLAFAEWQKLVPDEQRSAVAALDGWKASRKWQEGFVRDCERWLKYREWEQEPPPPPVPRPPSPNGRRPDEAVGVPDLLNDPSNPFLARFRPEAKR